MRALSLAIFAGTAVGLGLGCTPSRPPAAAATAEPSSPTPEAEPAPAQPNARHDGHRHHHHHRFDDARAWAEQFDDPSRDAWQKPEAVIDFIAPVESATIADLGAGTGYFAVRFAKRVPTGKVLANDVEPDMVRYLGERAAKEGLANVVAVQGTAEDPALPEPVDVAFMCDVAHHIEDRPAYFAKVAAALKPGGRIVIVDFKKDAPADAPGPPPAMRIAEGDLVAELAGAGLSLARSDRELLPHQYIVELVVAEGG